jgi:hypothetical protein
VSCEPSIICYCLDGHFVYVLQDERKSMSGDVIRKRIRVDENRTQNTYVGPGVSIKNVREANVEMKQETVSLKSLWIPLLRYKRQLDKAKRDGVKIPPRIPLLGVDTGTEFQTSSAFYSNTHDVVRAGRVRFTPPNQVTYGFVGPLRAFGSAETVLANSSVWPSQGKLPPSLDEKTYLLGKGTTAIARTTPTNPLMDVSVSLGEFRKEGLPKLAGLQFLRNGGSLKDLGHEYLNYEFGIKPLANDIMSLSRSIVDSEKVITQLERDSGRVVRRKYHFPDSVSETTSVVSSNTQPQGYYGDAYVLGGLANISGPLTKTVKVKERVWFSGAYTYHYDRGQDLRSKMASQYSEARKLYGLKVDLETLYNLTGWTWLFDWFTNTGDVMSNLSNFGSDGLVLKYGYVMCETTVSHIYTHTSTYGTIETIYGQRRKLRYRASPYGFGSDLTNLSVRQIAILAALGLTAQNKF